MNKSATIKNGGLYAHPFSISYWRSAAAECKNLRVISAAALLIALQIAMNVFFIPLPLIDRRIYFTFLPTAVCSMICGPLAAIAAGFISDIIGFMVAPTGAFYFGYTISSIAGSVIYSLFLYRARPSFIRLLLAKASVNLFVNTVLGAVWLNNLTGRGYSVYLGTGAQKNLALLPFEVIVLVIFVQTLSPALARFGLSGNIKNLKLSWRHGIFTAATMLVFAAAVGFYVWSSVSPPAASGAVRAAFASVKNIIL